MILPVNSEYEISHSVRDALLRDEQLVRLLGGSNVFEGFETETSKPHINICESFRQDNSSGQDMDDQAIVTLQLWSQSGDKLRVKALIEATENALDKAGLFLPGARVFLKRNFAGSRKLPDAGDFQGIIRYEAQRHPNAA